MADRKSAAQERAQGVPRRSFLEQAIAGTAGVTFGLTSLASRIVRARPSETVRIGFIGVGSRGTAILRQISKLPEVQVSILCDVRGSALAAANAIVKDRVETTFDYRDVIDRDDIDAVVIGTPQHLHAPLALACLDAKKDIYLEKAVGYTIDECWDLIRAVEASDRVVQTGHQRHYSDVYLHAKELIDSGRIGTLTAGRGVWNRNAPDRRPCTDPRLNRIVNWRLYEEYTGGLMCEFGAHQTDIANWFVGAPPISVCGMGGIDYYKDDRDTWDNVHVVYTYPNGVRFTYTSLLTNAFLGATELFLGTLGTIETSLLFGGRFYQEAKAIGLAGGSPEPVHPCSAEFELLRGSPKPLAPGQKKEQGHSPTETLNAVNSFVRCLKTREKPAADIRVGAYAAIASLMANIAIRENRTVHWSEFEPK